MNITSSRTIGLVALLSALSVLLVSREARPVVMPLAAIVTIAAAAVLHIHRTDGHLPVFDVGVLTILITAIYSAVPLLGFWLAGLQWTTLSYLPLYLWSPDALEVGAFSQRHVLYLASLTGGYLVARGRVPVRSGPLRPLRATEFLAIALCGVAAMVYLWFLEGIYSYSYDPSYRGLTSSSAVAAAEKMPYVVRQLSHNVFAMYLVLKFCALAWLMSRWRDWRWRTVLFAWLAIEAAGTLTRMGARTFFAMLVVASLLLYHRLVKPLPVMRAALLCVLLLGGLLTYGLARDLTDPTGTSGLSVVAKATSSRWATMNEFQALYGIAYELHARKEAGEVGPIPRAIYLTELSQLIPSQLLPFRKADPCVGYPVVDGIGVGCALGVISQSVIGLGLAELILRGAVLGLLLAIVHRWYARHQDGYWMTILYLCLCLWCYYTFRGSTFFIVYFVLYRFVPVLLGVRLLELLLIRILKAADAVAV